jgi:hypothetical protein
MIVKAKQLARDWKLPFAHRKHYSLEYFLEQSPILVVFTQRGPVLHTKQGSHFFHLNLAQLRIKNIKNGKHDHMVQAMQLQPGMTVLDCTLGLASDAVVASFILGASGLLVGLESSYLLAKSAEYGLKHFVHDDQAVTAALRKIKVHAINYDEYLQTLPASSYDVVYFDPMFRHPVERSSQLHPIRKLMNSAALSPSTLATALRVARQRVVIKETHHSLEFQRLGIEHTAGGKYSHIEYGIIEKSVTS